MRRTIEIQNHLRRARNPSERGFALPVVITIGLFMMITGFALMARTFGSFRGSIKNNQQQQAQELAELGVSRIIDQLNSNYRYLWVNCYNSNSGACQQSNIGGWNNSNDDHGGDLPEINGASCLDVKENLASKRNRQNYADGLVLTDQPVISASGGIQTKRGTWTLESYSFQGNPWMGGRGSIRVRGDRLDSNNVAKASAVIEHVVEVKGKPCGNTLKDQFLAGTFPGLLAQSITLGGNDVVGYPSANVYCTGCDKQDTPQQTATAMGQKSGSVVDGSLIAGEVALPPVPIFPPHLANYVQVGDLTANTEFIIEPPASDPTDDLAGAEPLMAFNPKGYTNPIPMCVVDEDGVSHCKVNTMDLQKDLIARTYPDPSTGKGTRPIRIYLDGDIKVKGQLSIKNTGNSTSLAIFGTCASPTQSIEMNGGAQTKAFIYAPCATVGINGGSSTAYCTEKGQAPQPFDNKSANPDKTTCTDGDFEGAIWAKTYGKDKNVGAGSQSTNGEITVPFDIEDDLITIFGEQFSVGPSDFVGVGVPRWTSYQEP